jgi:hypothetical protein
MAMVAGDEAMSVPWHDVGVVVDPEAAGTAPFDAGAGYVPSYGQCQYYYYYDETKKHSKITREGSISNRRQWRERGLPLRW